MTSDLDDVRDKTLAGAPACVGALPKAARDLVAAWVIGEQVRLFRRYVKALVDVAHDAMSEADEAEQVATALEARWTGGGSG